MGLFGKNSFFSKPLGTGKGSIGGAIDSGFGGVAKNLQKKGEKALGIKSIIGLTEFELKEQIAKASLMGDDLKEFGTQKKDIEGLQAKTRKVKYSKAAKKEDVESLLKAIQSRESEMRARKAAPALAQTRGSLI